MSQLQNSIEQTWPVDRWSGERLLLAVSGGADSVALLRAIHQLAPNRQLLAVAHFNHGWRGAASDGDEAFVSTLCQTLGVHFVVGRASEELTTDIANQANDARRSEESARRLRYRFLTRTAKELVAHYILTAHTASDRVETMLHNLCRGTGLAGTCTPQLFRRLHSGATLVRPLIGCFREQVEAYLAELGQHFRVDSSNDQQTYRRNFLRHSVVPLLKSAYGADVERRLMTFSHIAEDLIESNMVLAKQYRGIAQRIFENDFRLRRLGNDAAANKNDWIAIPEQSKLPSVWPVVQQAIQIQWHEQAWPLQGMARRHWEKLRQYWVGDSTSKRPRVNLPGGIDMRVKRGWLILTQSLKTVE